MIQSLRDWDSAHYRSGNVFRGELNDPANTCYSLRPTVTKLLQNGTVHVSLSGGSASQGAAVLTSSTNPGHGYGEIRQYRFIPDGDSSLILREEHSNENGFWDSEYYWDGHEQRLEVSRSEHRLGYVDEEPRVSVGYVVLADAIKVNGQSWRVFASLGSHAQDDGEMDVYQNGVACPVE